MATCGRCGTQSSEKTLKCPECGDYLHQYRQRPDQPNRIVAQYDAPETSLYDRLYGRLQKPQKGFGLPLLIAVGIGIVVVTLALATLTYANPPVPTRPTGRLIENRYAKLSGDLLPERLIVSSMGLHRYADRLVVSVFRWSPFAWHLIYRSAGAADASTSGDEPFFRSHDYKVSHGAQFSRYVGSYPLLPGEREIVVFGTRTCGGSCADETLRFSELNGRRLRTIFTLGGSPKFERVVMASRGVRVTGDAYACGDAQCCPSRHHVSSLVTLSDDGRLGIDEGGAFVQTQDDIDDPI